MIFFLKLAKNKGFVDASSFGRLRKGEVVNKNSNNF